MTGMEHHTHLKKWCKIAVEQYGGEEASAHKWNGILSYNPSEKWIASIPTETDRNLKLGMSRIIFSTSFVNYLLIVRFCLLMRTKTIYIVMFP